MMMSNKSGLILVSALTLFAGPVAAAAQAQHQPDAPARRPDKSAPAHHCPSASQRDKDAPDKPGDHDGHLAAAGGRGEEAMGFSQTRTTHHFFLKDDGGIIQVEVNDLRDTQSRKRIRTHLAHIARAFAAGDFRLPMAVHDRTPPGASEMCRLRAFISYEYEETKAGGRVRIRTGDKEALVAVHEFLRFQIRDHRTGDPLEVSN